MSYTHLKRWTRPECYIGPDWPDYYVFLGQHRDSDVVDRSNFTCALAALGGESETVLVIRDSHWAVGWVEAILIHETNTAALTAADAMRAKLADYPILDDEHESQLEWDEASEWWARMRVCDRVAILTRFGLNVFGARHDWLPQDDDGSVFDYLRTP